MTKKEYILTLLSRLEWYRGLAGPLRNLVEHTDVDIEFIDGLCGILMHAVHEVADELQRDKLLKTQEFLKKLQLQELSDVDHIDEELDQMLKDL